MDQSSFTNPTLACNECNALLRTREPVAQLLQFQGASNEVRIKRREWCKGDWVNPMRHTLEMNVFGFLLLLPKLHEQPDGGLLDKLVFGVGVGHG
jgi:hypothetical protein